MIAIITHVVSPCLYSVSYLHIVYFLFVQFRDRARFESLFRTFTAFSCTHERHHQQPGICKRSVNWKLYSMKNKHNSTVLLVLLLPVYWITYSYLVIKCLNLRYYLLARDYTTTTAKTTKDKSRLTVWRVGVWHQCRQLVVLLAIHTPSPLHVHLETLYALFSVAEYYQQPFNLPTVPRTLTIILWNA